MAARTKVAILGGGPAGLTAAYELTDTPELRERYEVTVHTRGWKLGGKGATGRNRDISNRIEEHGLHIWFGCYDNAFALMQRCYRELDRPPGAPLRTWRDAFPYADEQVLYEHYDGRWVPHPIRPPRNSHTPGVEHHHSFGEMLAEGLERLLARWEGVSPGKIEHRLMARLLRIARRLARWERHVLATLLLKLFRSWLWRRLARALIDDDELRFVFGLADLFATAAGGILKDRLVEHGLGSVNDEEITEWLSRHGLNPLVRDTSPVLRGLYDGAFSYEQGDTSRPNAAAGKALQDVIRAAFQYRGAYMFKMAAGMGETVISPLYEVLTGRGVKFEFFHEVTALRPAAGEAVVDEVEIRLEALARNGTYEPTFDVDGLMCWPSEPFAEQLSPPGDAPPLTLKRGEDFDLVVLAIPANCQRDLAARLAERNPRYGEMLDNVHAIMTQSVQLWLDRDGPGGLGWPYGDESIVTSYVEPIDTYLDMSQTLERESWAPGDAPGAVAYLVGVLADEGAPTQEAATQRARANAERWIDTAAAGLWPAFDRSAIHSEYVRANFADHERYITTFTGTVRYRLKADESGFGNLFLAGDWTRNGMDSGCVEAAVQGGMLASRAICGHPKHVAGTTGWLASDRGDQPG